MTQELKKRVLSSLLLIPVICLVIIKGSFFFNLFLILLNIEKNNEVQLLV